MSNAQAAQKGLRQRQRERLRQMDDDVRAVLAIPAGRRFLYQMLTDAGVWSVKFAVGEEGDRFDGQRNFGCALMAKAQAIGGNHYAQMIHEATARASEDDVLREAAKPPDQDEENDDG